MKTTIKTVSRHFSYHEFVRSISLLDTFMRFGVIEYVSFRREKILNDNELYYILTITMTEKK